MSDTYRFEQFDRETRDYLVHARDQQGKGTPGIYVGKSDYMPLVGMFAGFFVLILTVLVTFPPTDPPVKEALLQTAGLVLGGWLILAALRVWMAGKSGGYVGHFVYADPDFLYVAKGSTVEVTDLVNLSEAKAVHNHSDEKYKYTNISLVIGRSRKTFQVNDEDRARRLTVYLNAVGYMRDGGETGKDETLRNLPPDTMGAVAKKVAVTGEFPSDPTRADEGNGIRVARPQPVRRASTGLLGLLMIGLVGTGIFFGLKTVNYPFRDEAVFGRIKSLPDKEKPPHLRLYLANEHFTAHRDEVRQELARLYETAVRENIQGTDPEVRRGLSEIVLALKDKPVGALSLRAVEEVAPPAVQAGAVMRQKSVADKLADKWGVTIGDAFVAFAVMEDPDLPTNIELRWKVNEDHEIVYTITFRHSPDEPPIVTHSGRVASLPDVNGKSDINKTVDSFTQQIISLTIGSAKIRPIIPVDEF